jgi:hypothetical protein
MSAPDLSHEACEKRLEIERVAHLMDRLSTCSSRSYAIWKPLA